MVARATQIEDQKNNGMRSKREKPQGDDELNKMDREDFLRAGNHVQCFPSPMREEAFRGIAGEVVGIINEKNEPCREALLAQFMIAFGNMAGRGTQRLQGGRHHLNEFMVLVGETALGRKGTSWRAVLNLLGKVDLSWRDRLRNGFQSGESIIYAVRDPKIHYSKPRNVLNEIRKTEIPGVADKRLLILEEEFARLLTVASRQGNIISSVARSAWDGASRLFVEGKQSPETATGAHISMIGHITVFELLELLKRVDNQNGFTNRILFIASKRWQEIAEPRWINWELDYPWIVERLQKLVARFNTDAGQRLEWSPEGSAAWRIAYHEMGKAVGTGGGIVGPIIARADAHVLRLTMLYAVLDDSLLMEPHHLKSALAFWDYSKRSAQWAFGENTGHRQADKLYWALQHHDGLTRDQVVSEVFSSNYRKTDIDQAVAELFRAQLITVRHEWSEPDKLGRKTAIKRYWLLPRVA